MFRLSDCVPCPEEEDDLSIGATATAIAAAHARRRRLHQRNPALPTENPGPRGPPETEPPEPPSPTMTQDRCPRCGLACDNVRRYRPPQPKLEIINKDCVIIGNGPSAISLSYFLSGNWPYYNGETLGNEYVQTRLEEQPSDLSLVMQDLEFLSDGVEGRSPNPVAVLYDMLAHPNADLGVHSPSALEWRAHPKEKVDHVVLGKGQPGGVWQMVDGTVNTLSISHWMELPNMPFREWHNKYISSKPAYDQASPMHDRATIADVRNYYEDYVQRQGLAENFRDNHVVTSVQKVLAADAEVDGDSGECRITAECDQAVYWEVCGKRKDLNSNDVFDFCYRTQNVVLAVGSHDQANRLGVQGEHLPYVMHSLQDFQHAVKQGRVNCTNEPLMIVGAGLSVGDAIAWTQNNGFRIAHVFRRKADDPEIVFRQLSNVQYPEYRQIHQLMTGELECDHYQAYEGHIVSEFLPDGQVMVYERSDPHRTPRIIQTSAVLVLIGSKPDLTFLPRGGRNLGVVPCRKVDSKNNPMDVDPYTYESNNQPGIFGLGALVGDNFVRFLQGGCLAICKRLAQNRIKLRDTAT